MTRYTKPYLPPSQQIALLKQRGMIITDEPKAEACLRRIGYYRLSAYWYPFRKSEIRTNPTGGQGSSRISDDYKEGADFPTVLDLYVFDKKLRMLLLDALERIEIAVRTDIALMLGQHHPLAHRDSNLLHGNFARRLNQSTGRTRHQEWLGRLDEKFQRSKEDFAQHFKQKYPGDHLPIWMAVELWDFGTLSHFFGGLRVQDKNAIAGQYEVPPGQMFEKWLRCLNDIRNICAHHSRLWNRPLVAQPPWPSIGAIPEFDHLNNDTHGQSRLYAALLIMRFLLRVVNPSSSWKQRLIDHIDTLPMHDVISLRSAGFPEHWKSEGIW